MKSCKICDKNNFVEIDFDNWDRKEIFNRFNPCLYTLSTDIDITKFIGEIKSRGIKFYPAINYCVAKVCNTHKEFRFANIDGKIGYFDQVHPLYTTPRLGTDLFVHKMTEWREDFDEFYNAFLADYDTAIHCNSLYCDKDLPLSLVCTSIMPDLVITGLDFNYPVAKDGVYVPFATFGKYRDVNGRIMLSVATQFRHEVNDGYHANLFFKELERVMRELF